MCRLTAYLMLRLPITSRLLELRVFDITGTGALHPVLFRGQLSIKMEESEASFEGSVYCMIRIKSKANLGWRVYRVSGDTGQSPRYCNGSHPPCHLIANE